MKLRQHSLALALTVLSQSLWAQCGMLAPPEKMNLDSETFLNRAINKPVPKYPERSGNDAVEVVNIHVLVNDRGEVSNAAVIGHAYGPLMQASLDALRNWTFKPFVRSGRAIYMSGSVAFRFDGKTRSVTYSQSTVPDPVPASSQARGCSGAY